MSQNSKLLAYLESHNGITTFEATLNLGIARISERVRELERAPYHCRIEHQPARTSNGARVIRYVLVEGPHELEPIPFAGWI